MYSTTKMRRTSVSGSIRPTLYFEDDIIPKRESSLDLDDDTVADAVLVYAKDKEIKVKTFLESLTNMGLEIESVPGSTNPNLIFVKISAQNEVLAKYADMYGISFRKDTAIVFPKPNIPFAFLENILNSTRPDRHDPVVQRAWKTISKTKPNKITSCERSGVLFLIMDYIRFGDNDSDVGLRQLLHQNVILEAYPLHDGPWEWPGDMSDEPINDRQLLAKYWASFSMFYKEQPLQTIQHYFGYEIATYFSWLGLYNTMLVYAAILGIIAFVGGLLFLDKYERGHLSFFCENEGRLCNKILAQPDDYSYLEKISSACPYVYITYANSNLVTCIYSFIIVLWCTIFKEAWKRQFHVQNAEWESPNTEDFMLRPQFAAYAKKTHPHKYTGEPELYIPFCEQFLRYTVSIFGLFLIICFVVANLVAIVYLEILLSMLHFPRLARIIFVNGFTLFTMIILEILFNNKVITFLTKIEMQRTPLAHEKSVIIKSFIFLFFNTYAMLIYIAFIKGKCPYFKSVFFKSDPEKKFYLFPNVHCMAPSCVFEVICLLVTILMFKPVIFAILQQFMRYVRSIKRKRDLPLNSQQSRASWEHDYVLPALDHRNMLNEFNKLIIQFGLVTFFASSSPLIPLITLIYNIITIRFNASNVVKFFKRPVEKKQVTSIGVCFDIFDSMTSVAIIINALYAAYTTKYIHLYQYYINPTAERAVEMNEYSLIPYTNGPLKCFLSGFYTASASKLSLTVEHYDFLKYKAHLALTFLLVGFLASGILSYIIPDVPRDLQEFIHFHKEEDRRKTMK